MKENILRSKSFKFSLDIISVSRTLREIKNEYLLSKQLLRAGTSIGANVREADNAETKRDFIHKMAIAQKESDETLYWLELLYQSDYLSNSEFDPLNAACNELLKIIKSIIISAKRNRK